MSPQASSNPPNFSVKDYIAVYKCLCDLTRLRILNLLRETPLCVCHFQTILDEPQSKMSKQLAYMKRYGLIESFRRLNWTIYRLPENRSALLEENLKCLQDVAFHEEVFQSDLQRLQQTDISAACPEPVADVQGSSESCC